MTPPRIRRRPASPPPLSRLDDGPLDRRWPRRVDVDALRGLCADRPLAAA